MTGAKIQVRRKAVSFFLIAAFMACCTARASEILPPEWAYAGNSPSIDPDSIDSEQVVQVPDSTVRYTTAQVRNRFLAPDWHPEDHPVAPEVVTRGRQPNVYACGVCHRITGSGGPENTKITGLPYNYIVRQLKNFRDGTRNSALPDRAPPTYMIALSKDLTDAEIDQAARYFSSQKPAYNTRVVETALVPKTLSKGWRLDLDPAGGQEPIGERIIELPDNPENFERRDSRATFTAFVPLGSVARGKALVEDAKRFAGISCVSCHGMQLQGTQDIPPLAARPATYLVRQFFDIRSGARPLSQVPQMASMLDSLTMNEMIAVAAYASGLKP